MPAKVNGKVKLLTTNDAAEILHVTYRTIATLCETGAFPGAFKVGTGGKTSPWRIPEGELQAYMQERIQKQRAQAELAKAR